MQTSPEVTWGKILKKDEFSLPFATAETCLTHLIEIRVFAYPNVRRRDKGVGHSQDLVETFVGAYLMSKYAQTKGTIGTFHRRMYSVAPAVSPKLTKKQRKELR